MQDNGVFMQRTQDDGASMHQMQDQGGLMPQLQDQGASMCLHAGSGCHHALDARQGVSTHAPQAFSVRSPTHWSLLQEKPELQLHVKPFKGAALSWHDPVTALLILLQGLPAQLLISTTQAIRANKVCGTRGMC
jgi:hypothetical protein